jgi:hypothetical protein
LPGRFILRELSRIFRGAIPADRRDDLLAFVATLQADP